MRQFSAARVLAALFSVFLLSLLVSCSGTNASSNNAVTNIVVTPTSLSLNPGQVARISAVAQNAGGSAVAADMSFSSSSSTQVTVSPGGLVCAGTWDANFINCNALPGQSAVGQATITATSGTVTATAAVYTHLQADRVIVNPVSGCVSVGATPAYTATVYNATAAGCSTTNPCDITASVGPITFTSTDLQVMANNVTSGVLTATNPGATGIYAAVSGLNSVPQPALVCPVVSIKIHDAASSNTTFNLSQGGTQNLIADVIDSNGVSVTPLLTWASSSSGSATIATTVVSGTTTPNGATITSVAPGNAIITATCSTPNCNRNVFPQYPQNVVVAVTAGGSSTTVYAASTSSFTLIPIPTSTNTPGTAISLPFLPNSMVSNLAGTKLYLGSSSGLIIIDTVTAGVTTAAVPGKILAISPDGLYLLISNSAGGATYFYAITNAAAILSQAAVATAATFTPDSKSASYLVGPQLYYETTAPSNTITGLPFTPDAIDVNAEGGLTYVTSASAGAIDVRSTCDQSEWQTLAGTNPTLVAHIPNGTGAVVADSPAIDVVTTGTVQQGCPTTAANSVATYNLGVGPFTAQQLLMSSESLRAWIISDLTSVVGFNLTSFTPTVIPLKNGVTASTGGITLDGSFVYVGASDNNVHRLNVASAADDVQISVGLKDSNSNAVVPNLVVVLPK